MAAKCRSFFAFLLVIFALSPLSVSAQEQTEEQARREFLFNLGFEDVVKIMREKLAKQEYANELNRRQLNVNIQSYEVINAARELSISILAEVGVSSSKSRADAFAMFVAKMLALKPLSPTIDYPSSILNIKNETEREIKLVEWLSDERLRQMDEHKKKLLSDIVTLMYGTDVQGHAIEIKRIDQLLAHIVQCMYLNDTIGNGRYFGRALLALAAREEKVHGGDYLGIQKKIGKELKSRYDLHIENFIGDEVVLDTRKGEKKVKITNGTTMLSRNLAPGSLSISIAAIPKNLKARWQARMRGMIGTPFANLLYVQPEQMRNGITLGMRLRDRIAQSGYIRMGYSHVVYFQVLEDPKTKIKMARVIDNYPNTVYDTTQKYVQTGGTRLTFLEQVIDLSHHSAAYFAKFVPEKLKKAFAEYVRKNGYKEEIATAIELQLDEAGINPLKNDKVISIKPEISKADFDKLHSENDPKKFANEVGLRFTKGLVETVYKGTIFHWVDPNNFSLESATYCSLLGHLTMFKHTGAPFEIDGSMWHWAMHGLAELGETHQAFQKIPGVETSMRLTNAPIVAPITLALQSFMEGQGYVFTSRTPEQKMQSPYLVGAYREADPNTTYKIQSHVPLISYEKVAEDVISKYSASIRDIEYGYVIRASNGLKTPYLSEERIAESGTKAAMPAMQRDWKKHVCDKALAGKSAIEANEQ